LPLTLVFTALSMMIMLMETAAVMTATKVPRTPHELIVEKRRRESMGSSHDTIMLDIGGTTFQISKSYLTKNDNGLFKALSHSGTETSLPRKRRKRWVEQPITRLPYMPHEIST
jgi:hypothetical protein